MQHVLQRSPSKPDRPQTPSVYTFLARFALSKRLSASHPAVRGGVSESCQAPPLTLVPVTGNNVMGDD